MVTHHARDGVKMSENRVDPTVAGLFLTALITLVFGFLGVELYNDPKAGWIGAAAAPLAAAVGVLVAVLMVSAIRCGNKFAAALFGFVSASLLAVVISFDVGSFVFFIIAIIYIVFVIVAFMTGAPKLLAIMLLFVGLLYLFVGLSFFGSSPAEIHNLLFGIFGLLAGAIALYLALALSTEKFPVF